MDAALLERYWVGPRAGTPIVFLHEGLGSARLWRDFPERLCTAAGRLGLVYSRTGYGASPQATLPRPDRYMHDEAEVALPALLDLEAVARPVLFGHSDGASIALIFASLFPDRVSALVLEAPHVMVEDLSIASIAATRDAYVAGDLRARLARHHADVDGAFQGWCDAWLRDSFRDWDLRPLLSDVRCPVLVIQGAEDEYGTLEQVREVEHGVAGPVQRLILDDCAHAPHRDQPQAVIAATAAFLQTV
ncbi:alpha/beta fold hydrolase [Zavarzinia sp. CC-PAN008]|uniref:alpha/beta fold hydrolase n=1 Tax=Zavarzinia sp. CC-PAN008 TaxID=3243332 RepID=UPI003F747CFE